MGLAPDIKLMMMMIMITMSYQQLNTDGWMILTQPTSVTDRQTDRHCCRSIFRAPMHAARRALKVYLSTPTQNEFVGGLIRDQVRTLMFDASILIPMCDGSESSCMSPSSITLICCGCVA